MAHHHNGVSHVDAESSRALLINLIIVVVVMIAEIVGGLLSNSLALVGDAGHMLVDALALGLAILALSLARRPATTTRTFGFHRAEIMAALINGAILVVVSTFVFYEAYQRIKEPPEVKSGLMLVIASIGLVANLAGIWFLRKTREANLNIRAAFWHVLGDTISSVGVVAAGIIIALTGWTYADPIIAIVIGIIILYGAVQLVRESTDILLEAVPKGIDLNEVTRTLRAVEGVKEIHDVHVWTITSGIYALSTHLFIQDQMLSRTREIINTVNRQMAERFNITHTTLQVECDRCDRCAEGLVCELSRLDTHAAEHNG
jgi:cobalt-zinc-cadmium efflux system protein